MAYISESLHSIDWETLQPNPNRISQPDNWDQRWQSSFLYPAHTSIAYHTRSQQIKSIRSDFKAFVQNLLTDLTGDVQFWSTSNSSKSYEYIKLQRLDNGSSYNQWRSRLRSFELIHLILSYENRELFIHTPLALIIHHRQETRSYPILAIATVQDLSHEYVLLMSNITAPIECQRQMSTGRLYFMGDQAHNTLMIPYKNDVYLRTELILHFAIAKNLIQRSHLEMLIRKQFKSTAKSLDRLRMHSSCSSKYPTRSTRITNCLHQNGVNCRCLGVVQTFVKTVSTRLYILQELISRSAKFLVRTTISQCESNHNSQVIDVSNICIILQDRYDFTPSMLDIQIISEFIYTYDFWQRLAIDCSCRSELLHSVLSHRMLHISDEEKKSLMHISILEDVVIQYDPVWINSDLISIDMGIERWRQRITSSFDSNHITNADLLAKRSNVLLFIMYQSSDYATTEVNHILMEISKIITSSSAKYLALSNAAVVLSYLQRFTEAFAVVNNIQSHHSIYLLATAQVQYNRGLLQDYVNTLHTILRCGSSSISSDSQHDILLKLIDTSIELHQFHDAASLLKRIETHLRRSAKPVLLVRFLLYLSRCYQATGQYNISSIILERCLDVSDTYLMGSDRIYFVHVSVELAELRLNYFKQANFAIRSLHQCLTHLQLVHNSSFNDRYMIILLRKLGRALLESGNTQLASRMLRMSVVRGQAMISASTSNMFEITALTEIATSYAVMSDFKKSNEIWSQAWSRLSSSPASYHTRDCLEIALNYSKDVQDLVKLDEVLQSALQYANQTYSEHHGVPADIKIRIARLRMSSHRYDEAESLLTDLHVFLNSTPRTRNSQIHIQCWVTQAELFYKQRRLFDLKTFIADRLLQLESENVCFPICKPEILLQIFVFHLRVNQKLCEFTESHFIIDRARSLCSKMYGNDIASHALLRDLSLTFLEFRRLDLSKLIIIEEWERCKSMAFHQQYLRSDSLQLRSKIWFLQFALTTITYANILRLENMMGLACKALNDVLEILLQLKDLGHRSVQDLLFQVRFTEARLMFKSFKSQEERDILLEILKHLNDENSFRKAIICCRLSSLCRCTGDKVEEKQFFKLAVSTLMSIQDAKCRYLLKIVKRASRSMKGMTRLCNLDLYNLDSDFHPSDAELEQPADAINSEQLLANRLHILKKLQQFEQCANLDYIATTLIELAQVYKEERMFSEAAVCMRRATAIIESRRMPITIPDLQIVETLDHLDKSTTKTKSRTRKREIMRPTRLKTNTSIVQKIKSSPYLS